MASLTNASIAKSLSESRGLIAVAARKLGVERSTIYRRVTKSPQLRQALEDAREFTTDVAEAKLFQAIEQGEAWAVCFYLKTQGKERGYAEKREIDHTTGGEPLRALTVRFVRPEGDAGADG